MTITAVAVQLLAFVARAQNSRRDAVRYSLCSTTSLGQRGVLVAIMCETPDLTRKPPGRYLEEACFRIPQVGTEALPSPGGFSSSGDPYPVGSSRFYSPFVSIYLTEKDEPITIVRNEDSSWYRAWVPLPWAEGCNDTLIRFDQTSRPIPHAAMTAEISGTMANRDILITLRGKAEVYFFKFDFDSLLPKWIQLPQSIGRAPGAATRPALADAHLSSPPGGDQIRVSFIGQQNIGVDSHLVTLLAECPTQRQSSSRAFYYFVQNSPDGSGLKFLLCRPADHEAAQGRSARVEEGAATGVFSGSMRTMNAGLILTVGKEVTHFKYDYVSGRWVEEPS